MSIKMYCVQVQIIPPKTADIFSTIKITEVQVNINTAGAYSFFYK